MRPVAPVRTVAALRERTDAALRSSSLRLTAVASRQHGPLGGWPAVSPFV
jgi:hypothetical protein